MKQIRDWLNEQGMKNTRGNPLTYNSVQHLLFCGTVEPISVAKAAPAAPELSTTITSAFR